MSYEQEEVMQTESSEEFADIAPALSMTQEDPAHPDVPFEERQTAALAKSEEEAKGVLAGLKNWFNGLDK